MTGRATTYRIYKTWVHNSPARRLRRYNNELKLKEKRGRQNLPYLYCTVMRGDNITIISRASVCNNNNNRGTASLYGLAVSVT